MANSLCFAPICSLKPSNKPEGIVTTNPVPRKAFQINQASQNSKAPSFRALEVKATDNNQSTKRNSLVCPDCEANGVVACSQCKGTGVNSVDHFNGRFKAGGVCWLCRGKKDMLCGKCNGAGFVGGFMSTYDD